jgi:hypothetical protein
MIKKLKFFLAPLDLCGLYSGYADGLRELGHTVSFLNLSPPEYSSWDFSKDPAILRWFRRVFISYRRSVDQSTESSFLKYLLVSFQWGLVFWVALKFNVTIFKSGETITGNDFEYKIYKFFNVKIISYFHASDSRPAYLLPMLSGQTVDSMYQHAVAIRRQVRRASENSDIVIDNPMSGHFQPRKFCIYQMIGNTIDHEKIKKAKRLGSSDLIPAKADGEIFIFHAPSNPQLKGSDFIRNAVTALKEEGLEFIFLEITGRPNIEVLQILSACDIVIDQLYSDIDAAVFALEACSFGAAVVVGGYGADSLKKMVPAEARTPTCFVEPSELKDMLRRLIEDAQFRKTRQQATLQHFENYASSRKTAERLVQLASGEAPDWWFIEPSRIDYLYGTAGSKDHIVSNIRSVVGKYGIEGLLLEDKPELQERFAKMLQQSKNT